MGTANPPPPLVAAVQKNCHISDARFAGNYSLCTYLLKMREFYRWEHGLAFGESLPREEIGRWVEAREQLWESLERESYAEIPVNGRAHDPLDQAPINAALAREGLIYSGGYGRFAKPHFFLGDLLRVERFQGYTIYIAGTEYARDLTAPPAMTREQAIFIRRESLRRLLWEKVEEWRWKKRDNPMGHAIAHYDFDRDLQSALEAMTDNELEAVILHEVGEIMAGELLGDDWHALIADSTSTSVEIVARAVRDHLADCLSTLPALLDSGNEASLHLYFASLNAMRKELFPALVQAYWKWVETREAAGLKEAVRQGHPHWLAVARRMLERHREAAGAVANTERLIEEIRL